MNLRSVEVASLCVAGCVSFAAAAKAPAAEVVVQALPPLGSSGQRAVSVKSDGGLVVLGGKTLRLFDPRSGLLVRVISFTPNDAEQGEVVSRHVALSPDGNLLAASVESPTGKLSKLDELRFWDTRTGALLKRMRMEVATIEFLADGRLCVKIPKFLPPTMKRIDDSVTLDPRTWKSKPVKGLLPDEDVVATDPAGNFWVDGVDKLTLVDSKAGNRIRSVQASRYERFAFNADFTRVVLRTREDEPLQLIDTTTGAVVRTLPLPKGLLRAVGFAGGGKSVLAAALPEVKDESNGSRGNPEEYLYFFSVETGALERRLALPKELYSAGHAIVADGRILIANTEVQLRFYDTDNAQQIAGEAGTLGELHNLSWSDDGSRLLVGEGNPNEKRRPQRTQLWELGEGRMERTLDARHAEFVAGGSALLFHELRKELVDARTFAPGREVPRGSFDVGSPAEGALIARSGKEHVVELLDRATQLVKASLPGSLEAFTADGSLLLLHKSGVRQVQLYDGRSLQLLRTCGDPRPTKDPWTAFAFSPDRKTFAIGGKDDFSRRGTLELFETATCKRRQIATASDTGIYDVAFSADGSLLAVNGAYAQVFDARTGKQVALYQFGSRVASVAFRPGHDRQLAVATDGGEVALFRVGEPQAFARLIGLGASDWIILLPDNRYAASRGALKSVAFRVGTQAVPFEQFDLRFNRPDAVLAALESASPARLEAARAQVQRRLKRAGFTEEQLTGDLTLPEVAIVSQPPPTTKERELVFEVRASAPGSTLDRLLVTVNDVPIAGSAGIDLKGKAARELTEKVALRLSAGSNRVLVSALDGRGVESLRRTFQVVLEAPPAKPDLYVVAVGVSAYRDAERSLRYAAKDASDLAAFFEKKRDAFGQIKVLRLLDGDATKEKIAAARQLLASSAVDDEAVVFFAGHGLRDEKLDYYFATADIDFEHPAARGLPYEDLEGLLENIPARRKLLLIDTCNSGELDKGEATLAAADTKVSEGVVRARGIKAVKLKEAAPVGLSANAGLLEDMLADLRRGSGAVAIASAGGAEFALESDAWKNGVFTYALLSTMAAGKSKVSEVRDQVTEKVTELTAGQQRPTVRRENLRNDFSIY